MVRPHSGGNGEKRKEKDRLKMATKGVSFQEINIDLLYHTFKYLTLKERVAFERVCHHWGQVMDKLWMVQKTLAFRRLFNHNFKERFSCPVGSHEMRDCDLLSNDWDILKAVSPEVVRKILSRCHNLTCLLLMAFESELFADFGSSLGRTCPKLEHISLRPINLHFHVLMDFANQVKYQNVKLKCIEIKNKVNPEDFDANGINRFKQDMFPLLETLSIFYHRFPVSSHLLRRFVPQLKSLSVEKASFNSIKIITHLGRNLVELRITYPYLSERKLRLICEKLPKLKSIVIDSCFKYFKHLEKLIHLEKIVWYELCCSSTHSNVIESHVGNNHINGHPLPDEDLTVDEPEEDEDLQQVGEFPANNELMSQMVSNILQTIGSRLKLFQLHTQLPLEHTIRSMSKFCPKLEYFGLYSKQPFFKSFESFSELKHLRTLYVGDQVINEQNMRSLLSCLKLKRIYLLANNLNYTLALRGLKAMTSYSKQCPKRSVRVVVASVFNDTRNQVMKERVTCFDNLWTYSLTSEMTITRHF